ncbi:hypothetical protein PHLCEN_2v1506 [Hermanssonia centrifuga]|uniref:Uncharacterized protein n=1 Tax=Hermanssonia centrifuga TaxID=98765 RepID=A0A2R6RZT7_9APHY|nr:hypothetical protein PHLCEN_2v1506 [Hermanssonia centrifuga]
MESFANVYASEMFIDDGRGIPLWHPEPELHIGDVGLFYNGGFIRLFNITVPAGHPYNSGRGVPPGFRPLRCNPKLWQTKDTPPGAFKTRDEMEATARDLGGGFFMGDTPKEHIGWEIECQSEWGALLILRDYAKQESLLSDKQCMRYIYANHMSWYHFAMASHLPFEFEPEDVVLVKGTVKTSDWAVLALQVEHNMSDEAPLFRGTFEPEETGGFVLSVKESSRMCYEYHCSPTGPQRQDHCLFVSHYRIKYRDGPPGLGSSHSIEVDVTYPDCYEYVLLDILEGFETVDVAITNDADFHGWFQHSCKEPGDVEYTYTVTEPNTLEDIDGKIGIVSMDFVLRWFQKNMIEYHLFNGPLHKAWSIHERVEVRTLCMLPNGLRPLGLGDVTLPKSDDEPSEKLRFRSLLDDSIGWVEDADLVSMAVSPDGRHVAVAGYQDHIIRIWDIKACKLVEKLRKHRDHVTTMAYSPSGDTLLSGGGDWCILWASETTWNSDKRLLNLWVNHGVVAKVVFAPDGQRFARGGPDSGVALVSLKPRPQANSDTDNGVEQLLTPFLTSHYLEMTILNFSPDGSRLICGATDGITNLLDVVTGERITRLDHAVTVSFSPDGSRIVAGCGDGATRIWDARTGKLLLTFRKNAGFNVMFSPDGSEIAACTRDEDSAVLVYDANSGRRHLTLREPKGKVSAFTFSHAGDLIASGTTLGSVSLWDAKTGKLIARMDAVLDEESAMLVHLAFSSDDKDLICLHSDTALRVWSIVDIERLAD